MIKRNTNKREPKTGLLISLCVVGLILLGGAIAGLSIAASTLTGIWHEQCRVDDQELDVVITTGKMVYPEVVTLQFGLTNGANLAEIPFADLRADLLKRVPNVRDIRIERRLPNRVTIDVVEREPLARIASRKGASTGGRVSDSDGVVFLYNSSDLTSRLPIVREATDTPTPPGKKLSGLTAAALRLVEVAGLPELSDLRVQEVDTSHKDYLLGSLGNLDHAQIAWDRMQDDSSVSRQSLARQLRHLSEAIATRLTPHPTLWLATDWGKNSRITASGSNFRAGN